MSVRDIFISLHLDWLPQDTSHRSFSNCKYKYLILLISVDTCEKDLSDKHNLIGIFVILQMSDVLKTVV